MIKLMDIINEKRTCTMITVAVARGAFWVLSRKYS